MQIINLCIKIPFFLNFLKKKDSYTGTSHCVPLCLFSKLKKVYHKLSFNASIKLRNRKLLIKIISGVQNLNKQKFPFTYCHLCSTSR